MTDRTIFRLNPAKNPFLGNLPIDAMESLMQLAKLQRLKDGEIFIREGDPSDSIYFISWGDVAVLKGGVEIDQMHTGAVIGEMGVLKKVPRSASIQCKGEVEVLRIEAVDFLRILDTQPAIWRTMLIDQMGKVTSSQDVRKNQEQQIVEAKEVFGRLVSPEVYRVSRHPRTSPR